MIETPQAETAEPEVPPQRRTWIRVALVVAVVAVITGVFYERFGEDPRLVESPLIGQPLPELILPYLEQDGSLDFADLKGQALVINFWASWCFPCRLEHPALTAGAEQYEDDGVHFVGISYQDRREPAIGFLDEFGRGTNYSYVMDTGSRTIVELGVFGVPETYFVDADGIIRARIQGEVNYALLSEAIDEMLAEPAAAP